MSHELHANDSMAYRTLGGDPWHIAETRDRCAAVGEQITGPEMQRAAGLEYNLRKVKLYHVRGDGPLGTPVPNVFGVQRSDTGECLPGVSVGRQYEILQPFRMFEFGEAIRQIDGGQWETAGSLFGGRRMWALLQLRGAIEVQRTKGFSRTVDTSLPYALISTTHDGTQRTIVQHTSVRVVCWNTLSAAVGGQGAQHAVRHTASQDDRLKEAAAALGHALEWHTAYGEAAQQLADTPMSLVDARTFFAQIVTGQDEPDAAIKACADAKGRKRSNLIAQGGLLVELFGSGTGNMGRDRFDALNAVTEFIDRERARIRKFKGKTEAMRLDSALDSSQFGQGAKTKQRALRLLTR